MPNLIGRPCLFPDKAGGDRLQGKITAEGSKAFERQRRTVANIYKDIFGVAINASDGCTIEALARGFEATRRHLARRKEGMTK